MTTEGLDGIVGHLRRSASHLVAERTDGELLADFIGGRDSDAFDALVLRHGPMVLGVCRRMLACRQDAEDAFQAVFLVLIRKATSIAPRDMVGNWLYGVAHQTALRVRAQILRRQSRERQMSATMREPEIAAESGWDDLRPVLDEELSRLPDRYRTVVVLCDVEGRTRKDAARHLKCPEGSVSSRLARARAMLCKRLARRGIALSGLAVSALIAEHAAAHVSRALLDSTLRYAANGHPGDASHAPPHVSLIAKGVLGAMAVQKSIVTGVLVSALVAGSMTCGLVAFQLQAGEGGETPGVAPKKIATADQLTPDELVKQLDDDAFQKREAAGKALIALGAKALPAVRAGAKSTKPELAQRCEHLLPLIRQEELAQFAKAFEADTARKAAFDHPVWKHYVSLVGDSKVSRELFAVIAKNQRWLRNLDAAEADPPKAGAIYRAELRDTGKLMAFLSSADFDVLSWPCDQPEEVAYLMLLGSYKNSDPVFPFAQADTPSKEFAGGESRLQFGRGLALGLRGKRLSAERIKGNIEIDDGFGDAAGSERVMLLLLGHWLEQRNCWPVVTAHLKALNARQQQQLLPFARRVLADKTAPILCRAAWIALLRRYGESSDAVLLTPLFTDKSGMDWGSTTRFGDGPGNLINQAEVREVAIGSAIFLRGRDPVDFGFNILANYKPAKKRSDDIPSTLFPIFGSAADKDKALAKAKAWLSEQAKKEETPAPLKKLGRIAEPPGELQAAFARLDHDYRHGNDDKYREFEEKAAELLQKYPQPENRARILFQVAHVASQGGIAKHLDLVRAYGRKMLAISQDPLERGLMYSYLGSAAEIDPAVKSSADRRRLAAEQLLEGYREMLAQELPEKKPERPPLGPIGEGPDNGDPNVRGAARSREMAQMEAFKQAVFTEDLVFRRDTLILQLRWLYRPSLQVHGRNAEGPEELRALAGKMLKNPAAVDALLAKIVGPDRPDRPKELREPKWAVTEVKEDLVQIAVGSKQGLKIGDVLKVKRANDSTGKLRIVSLDETQALGQLIDKTARKVAKGDGVER